MGPYTSTGWLARPGKQTARRLIVLRDRPHTLDPFFRGDVILPGTHAKNVTGYISQGKSVDEGAHLP